MKSWKKTDGQGEICKKTIHLTLIANQELEEAQFGTIWIPIHFAKTEQNQKSLEISWVV